MTTETQEKINYLVSREVINNLVSRALFYGMRTIKEEFDGLTGMRIDVSPIPEELREAAVKWIGNCVVEMEP